MVSQIKNLIITANPGIGKTTLIKEVCTKNLEKVGGFYTTEIREYNSNTKKNERMGFRICTFSGETEIMAYKGKKSEFRLNKYGIDKSVIENIGVKSILDALKNKRVVVIDEIGTMEMISPLFIETVVKCFNSEKYVLATIRYRSQPFTDEIAKLNDTKMILLTSDNFDIVKKEVLQWLEKI